MFTDNYTTEEEIKKIWLDFAKQKRDASPIERWESIFSISTNKDITSLGQDEILFPMVFDEYSEEEFKNRMSPGYTITVLLCLAKKSYTEYLVDTVLPYYEFKTYFESTRLSSIFERNKDVSEMREVYDKYNEVICDKFKDETTLWTLFNDDNNVKVFDDYINSLADESKSFEFIDLFMNLLTYDFVKNYMRLPNERNIQTYDVEEEDDECDYDEPYREEMTPIGYSYEGNY